MLWLTKEVNRHPIIRWFKFTLKPPYSGASEHSLLAIWDTSHWNFLSNLDLRQLKTSLMTSYCQLLVTPGPFEYFGHNWVSSENQSFLNEGATGLRCDLGGFR